MIRWTEKADVLRLEYTHTPEAFFSLAIAAFSGVLATLCVGGASLILTQSQSRWFLLVPVLFGAVFFSLAVSAVYHCRRLLRWRGWAEIAIRGGHARWGGGGGTEVDQMIAVEKFEIVDEASGASSLVAVLTNGGRMTVLGPWPTALRTKAIKLAAQMNENLGG